MSQSSSDGEQSTVYGYAPTEPRVGSIKYVYGQIQELNFPKCVTDKAFDGWVYVKDSPVSYGTRELNIAAADIVKLPAYASLGNGNAQAPAIIVPPLTDFIKPSAGPVGQSGFVKKVGHVGNQTHSHSIATLNDVSVSFTPNKDSQIRYTLAKNRHYSQGTGSLCTGKESTRYVDYYDVSAELGTFGKFDCGTDDAGDTSLPEPPHNRFTMMMYIGRRTKPYQTVSVKSDSPHDMFPIERRTPYIGEFRLFAELNGKTSSQIRQSMADGTFDGWVYADGQMYQKTVGKYDFSDAYSLYIGTGGQFVVPKFENFLRMNGNPGQATEVHVLRPFHNTVPSHVHGISFDQAVGQTVSARAYINTWCYNEGNRYRLVHSGFENDNLNIPHNIVAYNITSLSTDSATLKVEFDQGGSTGGGDEETYPSHYVLPGMVYIGVKKA